MDITKVIIPAAGLGTRFLPWTKAMPKEMLPLLSKPSIHYIVEEALRSHVNQFLMITSKDKTAIANYFDYAYELDSLLKETNKAQLTNSIKKIVRSAHFTYIRQSEPLGLGHALLTARHSFGPKDYMSIMLPDDILVGDTAGLLQLMRVARQEKASVIAVQEVPMECVSAYGVVAIKKQISPQLFQVSHLVEKPKQHDAPSNLAIVGRYVLSSKIFKALDEVSTCAVEEIQLTDGITQMLYDNEKVFAYKVQGTRYDVGTPLGWLKANISFALNDPYYAPHIRNFLADLDSINCPLFNTTKNIEHIQ